MVSWLCFITYFPCQKHRSNSTIHFSKTFLWDFSLEIALYFSLQKYRLFFLLKIIFVLTQNFQEFFRCKLISENEMYPENYGKSALEFQVRQISVQKWCIFMRWEFGEMCKSMQELWGWFIHREIVVSLGEVKGNERLKVELCWEFGIWVGIWREGMGIGSDWKERDKQWHMKNCSHVLFESS